jgi:pyruvate dehydrogenase E2 component (dihydrolipoamide acetyltransferase)
VPVDIADDVAAQLEALSIRRGSYTLEPLNRVQKFMVTRLTEASRDIPTFPLTLDIAIDALLAARSTFNDAGSIKVSLNDLVVKAAALALKEVPGVNSSYTPLGLVRHQHADIAIAVATDSGLITPIVFAAEEKSIADIAAKARDLSGRARSRQLKPDEYMGGTFSISNLGMFGITSFGSIINPPQGAILSVGAGRPVVVLESGAVRTVTTMSVTLTCDHRVIDGALGAKWLGVFRRILEQPQPLFA